MSLIISSQPRTPITSAYVVLGFVIGAVIVEQSYYGIDSTEGLIIVSIIAGLVSSFLYFVEPVENFFINPIL